MKKLLITLLLLLLLIVLLFIGTVVYSYYTMDESVVPNISIKAAEAEVFPDSYTWSQPLLGGVAQKGFERAYSGVSVSLGTVTGDQIPLEIPGNLESRVTIQKKEDGSTLFEGSAEEYRGFSYTDAGDYRIDVTAAVPEKKGEGWGSFHYRVEATIKLEIELFQSAAMVEQGDVLALKLENVPEGITPTVETDISKVTFVQRGKNWLAYIPVSYMREPGEYAADVSCGDYSQTVKFQVAEGIFEVQNLTIDVSAPVITEANSPVAYQQYRNEIYPLYETADSELYWEDRFSEPLDQYRISTSYGIKRYTNGSQKASRHAGIDMAAGMGTAVKAPSSGKVVFAQYLLNTGNTVVIEHGAGLKTFYFHMDGINVTEGDRVRQGQIIGTVGTTGYSTGPHLHFEMRMANQAIDPFHLINGTGGFFAWEE